MIARRDLIDLDEEQLDRRLQAVKQRMPQPESRRFVDYLPSWYERHQHDFVDTVPTRPMPLHAAHAASELHGDDDGDKDSQFGCLEAVVRNARLVLALWLLIATGLAIYWRLA